MNEWPTNTSLVISTSWGNDSVALVQWVYGMLNIGLLDDIDTVFTTYLDTGWAAPGWDERVEKAEEWAQSLGFTPVRIPSMGMEELVRMKNGFPSNQYQFCTAHLKGIPFLNWIDEQDAACKWCVCG